MSLSDADASKIERAVDSARSSGHTQWVAHVVDADSIDPLRCYARCASDDRFLWQRCESREAFVAWGRVDEIESAGSERFHDVEAWTSEVGSRVYWLGEERPRTAPLFVGGFGFEEDGPSTAEWKAFPSARFVLPATIGEGGEAGEGRARFTLLARVEPGTTAEAVEVELAGRLAEAITFTSMPVTALDESEKLDFDRWRASGGPPGPEYRVRSDRAHSVFASQIGRGLEAIEAGDLAKVVLARSLRVDHDGRLDIPGFLERLSGIYPSCTLVAMGRGNDTFLAATPETLIRVEHDRIETAALAGSAPRGRTPEEDAQLAVSLKTSAKERAEHAHVVDAMREVLAPRCLELEIAEEPGLRQLFGIQHLETLVAGRLRPVKADGSGRVECNPLLRLVAALHPTPAVGGVPRNLARDWLRRNEGLDRGWYASPVGWLDAAGGGDFCVALRSALIRSGDPRSPEDSGSRAWIFAGAGIVAGSQPEQEVAETRVKLRALLAPLTEI
jgi:salicylate biosynthesis isochorismate synthase